MNWNELHQLNQLAHLDIESASAPILILKHSTRCRISAMALDRIERRWTGEEKIKPYYLDLLAHRDVSAAVEQRYGVEHESPQVLVIRNGQCVYTASHNAIAYDDFVAL